MKRVFTILAAIALFSSIFSQVPEKLSYQAVIRNSTDQLVTNQQIGMQISILKGSATGTVVYVETQTPTTNANGLVTVEIGEGITIDDFSSIEWSSGPYFIKTETDPTTAGGTSYTITGTSQLLSVPYALHAKTAESVIGTITENDPVFTAWDKSTGISITENQITDLDHFTNTDETDPIFSLSVAEDITAADTVKWNDKSDFSGDYNDLENKPTAISEFTMNANSQKITNLANPVNPQDAVTKAYVTLRVSPIEDTLFFGSSQYVIIPGISSANPYGAGNNPPNIPINLSPADGATVQPIALSLKWSCSDPDGDLLTYNVYIDTENASTLVISNLTETSYLPDNLQPETTYYWKVVATDVEDITSESEVWSFATHAFPTYGTVTDIDSNIYTTIQIGNQGWMAENLKVTRYADGTEIPLVTNDTVWAALKDFNNYRAYCWYDDDINNKNTYGALYTWAAVMNGENGTNTNPSNKQGVCPDNWHVVIITMVQLVVEGLK